jgi:chromosome segregation ATPase
VISIATDESAARSAEESLARLENELEKARKDLAAVKDSVEFVQAREANERLSDVRKRQDKFHIELSEMFSHVSRAMTKYSYNVSKETERRLQVMSSEPWKMFGDELSQYSTLLQEIIKSVRSGQIQLKDSDRVLQNLEIIQSSLPRLHETATTLAKEASDLAKQNTEAARRAAELEENTRTLEQEIEHNRQDIEQKRRQITEKNSEVDSLLGQVSESMAELAGKRYKITR